MKSFLASLVLLAASAAAQTTTGPAGASSTSSCAAQNILDACLGTENSQLASCETTDYVCQCAAYKAIVTCYNNCPGDPAVNSAQGQVQIFCSYATQFASSSSGAKTATQSAPSASGAAASTTSAGSDSSGTSSSSAAGSSKTNAAADLALNAGGLLAAVAGVVAAVL